MATSTDELFRDPSVRSWVAVQVVAILVWLGAIALLTVVGVDFLIVLVAMVLVVFGIGFLVDPRRSWWGAGPMAVMADPAARGRYRRLMTLWLVAGLGLMFVLVTVFVASGIVAPAGG